MSEKVDAAPDAGADSSKDISSNRGWRFWTIFPALCITALLSSVEATVVTTTLGAIVRELNMGSDYPWVINSYLLTSTAFQPIFGQLADLAGRRWTTISAVAIFILGSGISGGATNESMLIGGRTIQGIGGGGINMLIELIICDLVPLRERPKFLGLVAAIFAIGTSVGPFVGGALVQHSSWRWVFYINLPIGGTSLVLLFLFLNVKRKKLPIMDNIRQFDYVGSALVVAATVAIIFALSSGGSKYLWSSWRVIVPLVLGLVGLVGFHVWEALGPVPKPLTPPHLFANRTSAIGFFLTFTHAMLFGWVLYFLPVYFQAVLSSSTTRSGVQLLPTVTTMIVFALVGAVAMEKTGRYMPVHFIGLAIMAVGLGTFALLDENSSTGMWAGLQILQAAGTGLITTALLPAVQAGLSGDDNASSTATWSYIRGHGGIWGITIPVAVFNNEFSKHLDWISDVNVRSVLDGGNAYAQASHAFMASLSNEVRLEVISVYIRSLRITWIVAAAICAATCLLVLAEKEIKLRTQLDSEYGLDVPSKDNEDSESKTRETTESDTESKKQHKSVELPVSSVSTSV